jgi:hypothetical protein
MTETREAFRARVRAWLNASAPRKGEPGDFSAAHLVSAGTPEDYRRREREALGQRNTIAERSLGLPREVSAAPGQSSEAHSVRSKA